MRLLALFLLAASFTAGCTGLPAEPFPDPEEPSETVPTFDVPIQIASLNENQAEFPLAVSPDGQTILACTHGAFIGPTPKYVSEDAGTTWRAVTPTPPTGVAGDCWADLGDDGTWYFIDSQAAGNTVSSTSDKGKTWIVNRLSTPPIGGSADRPYLVPLGGKSMGLTYVQSYLVPGYVVFTRTDDLGATWSEPQRVSEFSGARTNVMHGPMLVSEDRKIIRIPLFRFQAQDWPSQSAGRGDFGFAVSADGGQTWTHQTVLASVEALFTPPAVAESDGIVYWAYQVPNGTRNDLKLLRSPDDGATWEDAVHVASSAEYFGYMWMDAAPNGQATLSLDTDAAFLDPQSAGEHVIAFQLDAIDPDGVSWARALAPAQNAEFSTVGHDESGRIFIMYRHELRWLVLRETASG